MLDRSRNRDRYRLARLAATALAAAITAWSPARLRGAEAIPAELRQALEKNAAGLSPLSISWEWQRLSDLPSDELLAKIGSPKAKRYFFLRRSAVYVRQGEKFSYAITSWAVKVSQLLEQTTDRIAFDGEVLYIWSPDDVPAGVHIETRPHREQHCPDCRVYGVEPLEAAGFTIKQRKRDVHELPESTVLHLLRGGARVVKSEEVSLEGASCVLVCLAAGDRRHTFWLDRKLQCAVRRLEERLADGRMVKSVTNESFQPLTDPPLWLPKRSRVAWHTWDSAPHLFTEQPLVLVDVVVSELHRRPADAAEFVCDYQRPGTLVADSRPEAAEFVVGGKPDEKGWYQYQIPAGPDDLAAATSGTGWGRSGVVLQILVLLTVVAAVIIYRRARSARR